METKQPEGCHLRYRGGSFAHGRRFPPLASVALLEYQLRGVRLSSTRPVQFLDSNPLRGTHKVPLLVLPAVSLEVSPSLQLIPLEKSEARREIQIKVVNNARSSSSGLLKASAPPEWNVTPAEIPFSLTREGEANSFRFEINSKPGLKPGRYPIEISAVVNGTEINEEYRQISVQDVWRFPIYRKAASQLEVLDLHIPAGLSVAYITGPGDKVPDTLQQLGIPVKLLGPENLASGDLSNYSSILVGVRAYEVRDDLVANNARLLEYVKAGGTLIVQYQRRAGWSRGSFPPYPARLQSDDHRVTDETAPVTILEPSNSIFNLPNHITESDFEGWVQERGLYFFQDRDPRFKPLLSMGDPGFPMLDGGLLIADYGKGKYVLTALSWFRQLPEGVPGAIRIFVNLISLSRQTRDDLAETDVGREFLFENQQFLLMKSCLADRDFGGHWWVSCSGTISPMLLRLPSTRYFLSSPLILILLSIGGVFIHRYHLENSIITSVQFYLPIGADLVENNLADHHGLHRTDFNRGACVIDLDSLWRLPPFGVGSE